MAAHSESERWSWNHHICETCWGLRNPDREPVRMMELGPSDEPDETCCFCHETTSSGIYVRHDPRELECAHNELVALVGLLRGGVR